MEWIDSTKAVPLDWLKIPNVQATFYLKVRWNEKRYGLLRTTGFFNSERNVWMTNKGEFKKKYVQWLKED
jgi:hypothetical protein